MIDESILKKDELAVFALRKLYSTHGYKKYKMRKFEEYDFYSENKDFLASEGIITFTDADGRLLALKPDVTLSILKNFKEEEGCVKRLYYNENVYRISETSHTYQEIMQTGLECMGDIGSAETCEVALLALQSLALISEDYVLDLAHAGLLFALLDAYGLQGEARKRAERKERGCAAGGMHGHAVRDTRKFDTQRFRQCGHLAGDQKNLSGCGRRGGLRRARGALHGT